MTDRAPHCSPENHVIPPKIPLAIKWLVVALVTVCHSLPVLIAFVSSPHFNTWSYSKLSSTRQSVDERLKEKWVYGHVVNDLPTNTGLMYSIFTILLTNNSDLTINQPKSPIIFLYFRHEPINKFNVTLRWRPPLVRVQVINLSRKIDLPLINYKKKRSVILIPWPTLSLVVDTRSVETTVIRGQNMQICHSLRCKQVDMSTADQLLSTSRDNTGTRLSTFRSNCRDVEIEFDFPSRKFRLILVVVSTW